MSLRPSEAPIDSLDELYAALDGLYAGIAADCRECQDPDCMGYIWVLGQEAERLLQKDIPLIRVNGSVDLIHSFPTGADGSIDLTKRYPRCGYYCQQTGQCSIHEDRPLTCRLYPIGPETASDGTVVWAIHEDCLHVRRMRERDRISDFEQYARAILSRLSPRLREEILGTYRAVHEISCFPDEQNRYTVLQEA